MTQRNFSVSTTDVEWRLLGLDRVTNRSEYVMDVLRRNSAAYCRDRIAVLDAERASWATILRSLEAHVDPGEDSDLDRDLKIVGKNNLKKLFILHRKNRTDDENLVWLEGHGIKNGAAILARLTKGGKK
jgi:hypothetical protein